MYQLEVKRWLIEYLFNPSTGWVVYVDIDAMEQARGGNHPEDKKERVAIAETRLIDLGVRIGAHPVFGRADIVAQHPAKGDVVIEVEGRSSRQREQAVYSALGQIFLQMTGGRQKFALAVPDIPEWEQQLQKIQSHVKTLTGLSCLLVSPNGVRQI